jgi:alpha-galactosidase
VSDRAWSSSSNGWGPTERDQSNGETASSDGSVLTVGGVRYPKGIGAHAAGEVAVALGGACTRFTAVAGIDAETAGRGSVVFSVVADGVTLYTSPTVTTAPALIDVDVTGRGTLRLVVGGSTDGVEFDHADWADARLLC